MPAFRYEAISAAGLASSGTVDALDRGDAVRKLARRGLQPHSITDADAQTASPTKATPAMVRQQNGSGAANLKRQEVVQFTQELADLLSAGLQLDQSLQAMEGRSSSALGAVARTLREKVRDGVPLSSALRTTSSAFGELYCNLVAAGEASGSLTQILERQGRYLQAMEKLRGRFISALVYPSFIMVSGLAVAVVFVTYLIPRLAVLIKSAGGGKMPALAIFLLGTSDFIKNWWWAALAMVLAFVATIRLLLQDATRRQAWHKMALSLPIYGVLLRSRFEVQFLETLGNLLGNGLPLNRALTLSCNTATNLHLRSKLQEVESAVADGGSLSRALEKSGATRPLVVDMIRVGEQTGELAAAVQKAAERFDAQLAQVIERATSALEPVIILCMSGMVGTMAWMMVSVVYKTLENLQR